MDNLKRYSNKYSHKNITSERAQQAMMIRIMLKRIELKYNLKNRTELSKLLGYSSTSISAFRTGHKMASKNFIFRIMFLLGINYDMLNSEKIAQEIDEYVNSNGHLIVDGRDYGKITE